MKTPEKWIIGIDEVGRGPLAGPVSVGVFMTDKKTGNWILKNIFENKLRDSKKLSAKKREKNYKKFLELKKLNKISFSVSHISNKIIDKKGISKAIQTGVKKSLKELHHTFLMKKGNPSFIRLDGLLKAPKEFKNQKTIIKGDEKEKIIAWASILAKVSRDSLMCKMAKKFPEYGFELHKGYGTVKHKKMIKKYGISVIHRLTFCKNT